MSLDDHAEELASSLGVDKAEVKEDLANLVEYSVPIDEAKQSLRRKYGDGSNDGDATSAPTVDSIAEITTADGTVSITARVLTKGKRSIFYDGEQQVIREGELADKSGTISYTAWTDVGFQPGDTITAGNASVREYQGTPELNIGESTTITIEEDTLEVPHEIGGERDLTALRVGDRGRTIEVTVESVERKTIDGRDGETEINSGVFGDESGRLPFTDWEARPEIEPDATLRIEDVYVREFRGVPEVTVSEFSTVTTLDRSIDVSEAATELSIGEAIETGGAYDVAVTGNVIELNDGSGLIERCPECNRVVQNGQCRSHGAVDPIDDLRVKAVLDDGTGTVTAILDDELTKQIYGGGLEKAREAARDAMDQSVVGEAIAEQIVGREYQVRGHLSVDEYGANLDTTTFQANDGDPADRAATLLDEIDAPTEVAE
jgi:replication factor A1